MELREKSAYLKGLAEGLEYDKTTKEGKLIAAMIELLDEICGEIDGINQDIDYLSDYVDELDKDLGDVEEYVFDDEDEDWDDECDGDCENCDLDCEDRMDAFEDVNDDEK